MAEGNLPASPPHVQQHQHHPHHPHPQTQPSSRHRMIDGLEMAPRDRFVVDKLAWGVSSMTCVLLAGIRAWLRVLSCWTDAEDPGRDDRAGASE